MKKHLKIFLFLFLIILGGCSSGKITIEQFLDYKKLFCNDFLPKVELGEKGVQKDDMEFYQDLAEKFKSLSAPKKYEENLSTIAENIQLKTGMPAKYDKANEEWEQKYPNRCSMGCDENPQATPFSDEEWKLYIDEYIGPLFEEQLYLNKTIFLNNDSILKLLKEDLIVGSDVKWICGEEEGKIRSILDDYWGL